MAHLERRGLRLYYESAIGSGGDAAPLVLVPGWCCDHSFFRPQFDHFGRSRAVVTMDLRGVGGSSRTEDGYDIPTLTDDVAWLCRELGLGRVVVVGHSLGGMIGVEFAARHPSLTAAVVVVDPGPIRMLPESRDMFRSFVDQLRGPDADEVRRVYTSDMYLPTDDRERRIDNIEHMMSTPLDVATKVIEGVISWNGTGALRLVTEPLLVIASSPGGSNSADRLMALKSDIYFGMTVGSGHFIQLEVPEQVNAMIERFLQVAVD